MRSIGYAESVFGTSSASGLLLTAPKEGRADIKHYISGISLIGMLLNMVALSRILL